MVQHIELCVNGNPVKLEIDEHDGHGEIETSKSEQIVKRTQDAFNQATNMAKTSAEEFLKLANNLSYMPSELQLEFGLKIDAEAGAVVAKASTGAHFKIKLTWEPGKSSDASKM